MAGCRPRVSRIGKEKLRRHIADTLLRLLEDKDVSVIELADRVNASRQTIYTILGGRSVPSLDLLIDVCDALSVNVDVMVPR